MIKKPRAVSACTTVSGAVEKADVELTMEEKVLEDLKNKDDGIDEPATDDNSLFHNVKTFVLEDEDICNLRETSKKGEGEAGENGKQLPKAIESTVTDAKPVDAQEPSVTNEEDQIKEIDKEDPKGKSIEVENGERIEALSDHEVHEEFEGDESEAETLEEEQVQLNAAARERKVRKEREIFVGGLDRDALEEHVRKVFEYAGEVVEVRMHVDSSTNKNKGYAFVQFATKEQASRALSEMKNPVV